MNKILVILLFFSGALFAQNIEQTYRNPIISGDFPDPTVIRVGEDYYAAGTSSNFVPAYPVYHSKDLINWELIGSVFEKHPSWVSGDCWAPELFYHSGTYYVYYTAKRKGDNVSCIGVATTKDITKGFTDHGILIEWGNEAIDAFVFKDDDGKLYITWKAYGLDNSRPIEILGSELNQDGLSLVGDHFSLTRHDKGWKGQGDEGQLVVKRNGYYYLLYSVGGCCDNKCNYRVHVARSKDLKNGPWEQREGAPILEGGELWKCSGHGTLVQVPDGRQFYLYHAYNAYDFEFVGRQGLLDELLWDNVSGWPYFRYGNNPTSQAPVPFKGTVQKRKPNLFDDFYSDRNNKFWQWDVKLGKPEVSKNNGQMTVICPAEKEFTFYGVRPQTGNYSAETSVLESSSNFKGLCVYGNQNNLISFGVEGNSIRIFQIKNGEKSELFSQNLASVYPVYLRAESVNGRLFRFYWSIDKEKWNLCMDSNVDGSFIPRWGGTIHTGLTIYTQSGKFGYFSMMNKY